LSQYRERFAVDVGVEMPDGMELTGRQRRAVAAHIQTLAEVLAFEEIKDLEVLSRLTYKVSYGHRHESTEDYSCAHCNQQAADGQNSENLG
jgi:hypothetical protein